MTYKQRAVISGTIAIAASIVSMAFACLAVAGGPSWALIVTAAGIVIAVVEAHHTWTSLAEHEYRKDVARRRYEDNYKL